MSDMQTNSTQIEGGYTAIHGDANDGPDESELEILQKELEIKKLEMKILKLKKKNDNIAQSASVPIIDHVEEEKKQINEKYAKKYGRFDNINSVDEEIKTKIKDLINNLCKYISSPCQLQPFLDLFDPNDIEIHLNQFSDSKPVKTFSVLKSQTKTSFEQWDKWTNHTLNVNISSCRFALTEYGQIECKYKWNYSHKMKCCGVLICCVFCLLCCCCCDMYSDQSNGGTMRFNILKSTDGRNVKICYVKGTRLSTPIMIGSDACLC